MHPIADLITDPTVQPAQTRAGGPRVGVLRGGSLTVGALALAVASAAMLLPGCGGGEEPTTPRVIEPEGTPTPETATPDPEPASMAIGVRVRVYAFPSDLDEAASGAIADFFGSPGAPVLAAEDATVARELIAGLGGNAPSEPVATQTASLTTGSRSEVTIEARNELGTDLVLEITPRLDDSGGVEMIYAFRASEPDASLVTEGLTVSGGRVGRLSRQAVVRPGATLFAARGLRGLDSDQDLLVMVTLDRVGG